MLNFVGSLYAEVNSSIMLSNDMHNKNLFSQSFQTGKRAIFNCNIRIKNLRIIVVGNNLKHNLKLTYLIHRLGYNRY